MKGNRFSGSFADRRMRKYIFPNIAIWMNNNGITALRLSYLTGHSNNAVNSYLQGISEPRLTFIESILSLTGMTFEEAFKRKGEANNA